MCKKRMQDAKAHRFKNTNVIANLNKFACAYADVSSPDVSSYFAMPHLSSVNDWVMVNEEKHNTTLSLS